MQCMPGEPCIFKSTRPAVTTLATLGKPGPTWRATTPAAAPWCRWAARACCARCPPAPRPSRPPRFARCAGQGRGYGVVWSSNSATFTPPCSKRAKQRCRADAQQATAHLLVAALPPLPPAGPSSSSSSRSARMGCCDRLALSCCTGRATSSGGAASELPAGASREMRRRPPLGSTAMLHAAVPAGSAACHACSCCAACCSSAARAAAGSAGAGADLATATPLLPCLGGGAAAASPPLPPASCATSSQSIPGCSTAASSSSCSAWAARSPPPSLPAPLRRCRCSSCCRRLSSTSW